MMIRRAAFTPRGLLLPALLAALAFASWAGGAGSVAATASDAGAGIVADADVALGTLAERTGRVETSERTSDGGNGGGYAGVRRSDRRADLSHGPAAVRAATLASAPDGDARRSLERAGRLGAPPTAPPPAS